MRVAKMTQVSAVEVLFVVAAAIVALAAGSMLLIARRRRRAARVLGEIRADAFAIVAGAEHLARLRVIKRLQREHLPLAEIRRRMEALRPAEIQRLAEESERRRPKSSARDYIREVMSGGPARLSPPPVARSPRSAALDAFDAASAMATSPAMPPNPEPGTRNPSTRAQYDRITLAPDVELHIRRPLSREMNRRVERLLQAARAIFDEEDTP